MNSFVESLKRLFKKNKITAEKVQSLLDFEKITKEEFEFITGQSVQ